MTSTPPAMETTTDNPVIVDGFTAKWDRTVCTMHRLDAHQLRREMRGSDLTLINAPAVAVAITVAVRGRYQFSLRCLFSLQLCPKQKSPHSLWK
jgi:hypothetical protein